MKFCFNQVFKPFKATRDGIGDCSICTPSPENKNCSEFLPITIWSFEAIDAERGDTYGSKQVP